MSLRTLHRRSREGATASKRRARRPERRVAASGSRVIPFLLVASPFFGLGAEAQDAGAAGREERVLDLLRRVARPEGWETGHWYPQSTFERLADGSGHVIVPRIPIRCGNSRMGVFDGARARELAREMFAIYGLAPRAEESVATADCRALLDGFDVERRVGFELRGIQQTRGMLATVAIEAPELGLDDTELRALEARGARIHVADIENYPLMDRDQFTPTLAYLAGIVSFLDEVTDGEDVNLSALLLRRAQRFPLPALAESELPRGVATSRKGYTLELVVRERATLRFDLGGERGAKPLEGRQTRTEYAPPVPLERPLPTLGAPTVLLVSRYYGRGAFALGPGEDQVTMRLIQTSAGVDVRASGTILFAPSRFDATAPFVVELELAPGSHALDDPHVIIGTPP